MEPREIVRRTLEFDAPPRVPRQLWLLPWASNHYPEELAAIQARFPDDIVHALRSVGPPSRAPATPMSSVHI